MTKGKSNVKKSGQKNRRVLWTPHDRTNTQDTTSNISSGKNKPIRQQQRMQRVTIKVPAGTLPGHQVKFQVGDSSFTMDVPVGHVPGQLLYVNIPISPAAKSSNPIKHAVHTAPGTQSRHHSTKAGNRHQKHVVHTAPGTQTRHHSMKAGNRHQVAYNSTVGLPPPLYEDLPATKAKPKVAKAKPKVTKEKHPTADAQCPTDAQWACDACTFLNTAKNVKCVICGKQRPSPAQPRSGPVTRSAAPSAAHSATHSVSGKQRSSPAQPKLGPVTHFVKPSGTRSASGSPAQTGLGPATHSAAHSATHSVSGKERPRPTQPKLGPVTQSATRSGTPSGTPSAISSPENAATAVPVSATDVQEPADPATIELSQAVRCLSNCGFYGSIEKGRLCNKCYADLQKRSKGLFSNDEAIQYLLDLAKIPSLEKVKFNMAYTQQFDELLQFSKAADHIKGVTKWETSIRPLTQFDKFPTRGTSACTFIAGVAALKQILYNQIPSPEVWARCISLGVAAFHAGMSSHPHLTHPESSKKMLEKHSGLGVNSDHNRNMTEALSFVLKQLNVQDDQKIQSISNMEEVFVALHADNEDQRNIASAMSAYPIGQTGLCQCLRDIFKRPSMAKGHGLVVTRSPETWCLCFDCDTQKLYMRDSHRKTQYNFESLDIFFKWILKKQSYFVPMSGCGIEHNLISITSWKPSKIPKKQLSDSALHSPLPPVAASSSTQLRLASNPTSNHTGGISPPYTPVPPPRVVVAPPRSSSTERRYDGPHLLTEAQFLQKYSVLGGSTKWNAARRVGTK